MTSRMQARTLMLAAALCVARCAGPSDPLTGLATSSGGDGGGPALGTLAFLVQPNNVSAGSPISPEVKVEALDTLGNVLTTFGGTVRVALASNSFGGTLSGTMSVAACVFSASAGRTGAGAAAGCGTAAGGCCVAAGACASEAAMTFCCVALTSTRALLM